MTGVSVLQRVATPLAALAAVMIAAFGLTLGLSERHLEPTIITHQGDVSSTLYRVSYTDAVSCGSPWFPSGEAPAGSTRTSESALDSDGVERCSVALEGIAVPAVLVTTFGVGVLVLLLVGRSRQRRAVEWEAEQARKRIVQRKRLAQEQRRHDLSETGD